ARPDWDTAAPSNPHHPARSADPTTRDARIPPSPNHAPSGTSSGRRDARKRRRPGATPIPHAPRPTARRVPDRISTAVSAEVEERRAPSLPTSDRKSTRLNSSHVKISYAVFCLKKKKK